MSKSKHSIDKFKQKISSFDHDELLDLLNRTEARVATLSRQIYIAKSNPPVDPKWLQSINYLLYLKKKEIIAIMNQIHRQDQHV